MPWLTHMQSPVNTAVEAYKTKEKECFISKVPLNSSLSTVVKFFFIGHCD